MKDSIFSPRRHIPKYSILILRAFKTPILMYFAIIGNLMMMASALIFYRAEGAVNPHVHNFWDALWWALCTVSTVGYGDIVPFTATGRITGTFLIVIGIMFFLSFMAILVSIITGWSAREHTEFERATATEIKELRAEIRELYKLLRNK